MDMEFESSAAETFQFVSPKEEVGGEEVVTGSRECFVEVKVDPIFGRHLVASRDLSVGEVILREKPLLSGPNILQEGLPVCLSCYSLVTSNYVCSKCGWPLCSLRCETEGMHGGFECRVFSSNGVCPDQLLGTSTILILRCLLLKDRLPSKWDRLVGLEGQEEARTESPNAMAQLCSALTFIQSICGLETYDYDLIHYVTGVVDVNELGAEDRQGALLYRYGSYLYEYGSLLTHNCVPNAHRLIACNSELEVIASVPIKKGEVIWTLYGESFLGTKERNEVLRSVYYFTCSCPRCLDPTELHTFLQGVKCHGSEDCVRNTAAYLFPNQPTAPDSLWSCSSCGQSQEDSAVSRLKEAFREEAEEIGSDRSMEKVLKLEGLGGKYRTNVFHPNHFLIFRTEYDIVQRMSYILYKNKLIRSQLEFVQRFVDLTRRILSIFNVLLPGFNRHRGRVLYFYQQGLLYLLQVKVNPSNAKRVDIIQAPNEFQEFLQVRKEGRLVLAREPEGSEESLLSKEMGNDTKEVVEIIKIFGALGINNNGQESQG